MFSFPMHRNNLCLLLAAFTLVGCGKSDAPSVPVAEQEVQTEEKLSYQERVQAAKQQIATELSSQLIRTISTEGAPAAISVCKNEAPEIAKRVGEQMGLKIGRTSFRLRNPNNQPPEWALSLVEKKVEEEQYVELPDGGVGALLPIHLGPQCMVCHGPEENIDEAVKVALSENYPEDQAIGFQPGELRGWFWVEVPK